MMLLERGKLVTQTQTTVQPNEPEQNSTSSVFELQDVGNCLAQGIRLC
jgi:hypothetical protein